MSRTLEKIIALAERHEIRISDHGYEELANDGIFVRDIVKSLPEAELLENYPDFHKGACVLVLQKDRDEKPIHAVWGIPRNETSPAVLITAYRPNPAKWTDNFRSRK